jgi:hypothetical protein
MKCLDVMPCNKHRFLAMPIYYYGHALPPPIVHIILGYAYQMTVLEDGLRLGDKLEEMLSWLHNYKDDMREHMRAYRILDRKDPETDAHRQEVSSLLHVATVNLASAVAPPKPKVRFSRARYVVHHNQAPEPYQGFTLPEMVNYL